MEANRILFITQEITPFVPESEIANIGRTLPQATQESGREIRIFTPKWGFINESGELVIDYNYSDGGYFTNNGVCFVGLSDEQMYMITLRF